MGRMGRRIGEDPRPVLVLSESEEGRIIVDGKRAERCFCNFLFETFSL
jgi:hypothetical protein